MITFIVSVILLLGGYLIYSRIADRIFGSDSTILTPAYTKTDGVDYVPMSWGKIFLIQFLNIAGLGPIFGAIAGAMWGPVAFLWIVLGNIFAGAVHDFFSGMISVRHKGASITEIVGIYLGKNVMQVMRAFVVFMMIMVGAVFVTGPAKILDSISSGELGITFWATVIFIYYIAATMFPVDKIIGRVYPFFGFALIFMAVSVFGALLFNNLPIPEISFANMHHQAESYPIFPLMFITIACGAVSGFHATQSPMMARCIKNEKEGRKVFYGAMVVEGLVALIWAAVGMSFWGGVQELNRVMIEYQGNAAWAVNTISNELLGVFGGLLALLGVVAAPITSGDTAFRSARLIIADFLKLEQKPIKNRLIISFFLFTAGFVLTQINFDIIWRYMAWANQTLATLVLWTITVYLLKNNKNYLITLIPATFMTSVVVTYLMISPEGFSLSKELAYGIGISFTAMCFMLFLVYLRKNKKYENNIFKRNS